MKNPILKYIELALNYITLIWLTYHMLLGPHQINFSDPWFDWEYKKAEAINHAFRTTIFAILSAIIIVRLIIPNKFFRYFSMSIILITLTFAFLDYYNLANYADILILIKI